MKRIPKLKNSLLAIAIGFSYPVVKCVVTENNKFLSFIDSLTIIGLVYILVGVCIAIYYHGDLDSIFFRARHPKMSDGASFENYKERKQKERENSFNYPLFCGILFVAISYILATFFY